MNRLPTLVVLFCGVAVGVAGLTSTNRLRAAGPDDRTSAFRQLEELLPTPNSYRAASGSPGHAYWQQQVDYAIDVELDDQTQQIQGTERITYTNRSPDSLQYLWMQLDANIYRPDADAVLTAPAPSLGRTSYGQLQRWLARETFNGGGNITSVTDAKGKPLPHTIVKTMMRVDLPTPLVSGEQLVFAVAWNYRINDSKLVGGRTGYELFKADGNYIYELAQWFPRLAPYTDTAGWQHKQFLGSGEFALEFGDYLVRITVPAYHVVGATGVLLNPDEVLSAAQRQRLHQAESAQRPVFVVTPKEAKANELSKLKEKKTWIFQAKNVRDFAFASSRKFIWDAQLHRVGGNRVMAMSLYPNEGEPLWSRYSTQAIIHTLNVYSRYTFPYPYPVAYSVNGPVGGMEYPMICFNGPRPNKDGTYSKRTKYGLISVVIHEVGHNYFPMIVNSDERQWTWMDEGLNTFLQFLAEQEWETNYPSRRGEPQDIVQYMRSTTQVPIMTNSESVLQFHNNAYAKPATALNILRESILGRELFDHAFREYARRWKFKHPNPADFFRTMEDASGVDLDWFFRGWFYTTAHTDIAIVKVRQYKISNSNPDTKQQVKKAERAAEPKSLTQQRNVPLAKRVDAFPELKDFYNSFDELAPTPKGRQAYDKMLKSLTEEERKLLALRKFFYVVDFENIGGLVMPIVLKIEFEDGSANELRIPAEVWRRNNRNVAKLIVTAKVIKSLELDPHRETADVDIENNYFPRRVIKSRFELFKQKKSQSNPMRSAQAAKQ